MKTRLLTVLFAALMIVSGASAATAAERRIALVIGEAAYGRPLPTAANDAGLVAQTLQAAGFDVTGARDLDEDALRAAFREFLDKAGQAGPDAAAVIYFSGVALQLEGENYLAPVNAPITRDSDIQLHALRLSDYLKPLAAMGLKAAVVVLDAARENPFALAGQPIAGGLALYEPGAGALLAFNAAPGTIAKDGAEPYGPYAHALAEMIRAGGMPLAQIFDETRLRVSETTKGAQIPWNSAPPNSSFVFFERTAGAPPRAEADPSLRDQPLAQLGPEGAFAVAVQKDTLQGYRDYLAIYPGDPMSKRVRALLAARREALYWRRARMIDTPDSYWSYLRRYPHGPHVGDADRMLALRSAALEPPAAFEPVDLGYPPPPPEELIYVDRPVIYFNDPYYGFPPPPPPPVYLLPPPPPEFVALPPPFIVETAYALPVPNYVPIPVYVVQPAYIAPPPLSPVFENIHNPIVLNPATNNFVVTTPQGQPIASHPLAAAGAVGAAAAIGVALPHVIKKFSGPAATAPVGAAPGAAPLGHAPLGAQHSPLVPGATPTPGGVANSHALPTQLPAVQPSAAPLKGAPGAPAASKPLTATQPLSKTTPLTANPTTPSSLAHPAGNAGAPTAPKSDHAPPSPSAPVGRATPLNAGPHPGLSAPVATHTAPPAAVLHAAPPTPHAAPPVPVAPRAPVARVTPPAPVMRAAPPPPVMHAPPPPVMHAAPPAFRPPPAPVAHVPPPAQMFRAPAPVAPRAPAPAAAAQQKKCVNVAGTVVCK